MRRDSRRPLRRGQTRKAACQDLGHVGSGHVHEVGTSGRAAQLWGGPAGPLMGMWVLRGRGVGGGCVAVGPPSEPEPITGRVSRHGGVA